MGQDKARGGALPQSDTRPLVTRGQIWSISAATGLFLAVALGLVLIVSHVVLSMRHTANEIDDQRAVSAAAAAVAGAHDAGLRVQRWPGEEHPVAHKLQRQAEDQRALDAQFRASESGDKIGHHACKLVQSEHERDLQRRKATRIRVKQNDHADRAVGDGEEKVCNRDDSKWEQGRPPRRLLCLCDGFLFASHDERITLQLADRMEDAHVRARLERSRGRRACVLDVGEAACRLFAKRPHTDRWRGLGTTGRTSVYLAEPSEITSPNHRRPPDLGMTPHEDHSASGVAC